MASPRIQRNKRGKAAQSAFLPDTLLQRRVP